VQRQRTLGSEQSDIGDRHLRGQPVLTGLVFGDVMRGEAEPDMLAEARRLAAGRTGIAEQTAPLL